MIFTEDEEHTVGNIQGLCLLFKNLGIEEACLL